MLLRSPQPARSTRTFGDRVVIAKAADDPLDLSLTALCAALSKGVFTPEDVAAKVVVRAHALRHLNAFITAPGDKFLAHACAADITKPLAGAPIAVKDNLDTVDYITTGGTPGLIDWQPMRDADVVSKLRAAGGLVAGKTNLHELALGITGTNKTFGDTGNPYNPRAISGGSSGGSAAAVAARILPAGLGTDTGGSVMLPAAICGIWGFRPTVGRVSQRGIIPRSNSRDTAGWFARDPIDLIFMDQIHADLRAKVNFGNLDGLRLGLPRAFFQEDIEGDVADVFADAVARLKKAGVQFVAADVPGLPQLADIYMALGHYERPRDLAMYLASHGAKRTLLDVTDAAVSAAMRSTRQRLMDGEKTSAAEYRRIIEVEQPKLRQAYASYFESHGVTAMFTPASPVVAKSVGDDGNVLVNGAPAPALAYARYTLPPTTAQLPGLSVPLALTQSGMPMGGLFIGPSMSDGALLGLGPALGKVLPPLPAPKLNL